jgi:hypothetical protein
MSATLSITTATTAEGPHRFAICVRGPAADFAVWRSQAGKRNYAEGVKGRELHALRCDWAGGCFTLCYQDVYGWFQVGRGVLIGGVCLKGWRLSTGSVKKTVVPSPGCDSAQIRPPCACTIRRQIAKPTPVPGYSSAVCKRLNGAKMIDAYLGSKPMPLSRMEMTHSVPFCSALM